MGFLQLQLFKMERKNTLLAQGVDCAIIHQACVSALPGMLVLMVREN
jgi:hypothetical protein